MSTKRTGTPWLTPTEYGRTLTGLSVNLIVRDVTRSLPFYRDVLGMTVHYADADFAALQVGDAKVQLHADHTYEHQPWAARLTGTGKRGLGAEIRIMGIDPDAAERRARAEGVTILTTSRDWPHGWRDVALEDPDGYVFAVGTAL
jgi:catechol 2,3-dioxygenase-like lactoylglutathione lyase family enzyme